MTKGLKVDTKARAKRLREIWDDIHVERPGTRYSAGVYRDTRALTESEWAEVVEAVAAGFPATLYSHNFGFSFALCVYVPSPVLYPGVETEPEPVILIGATQFPGNDPNDGRVDQKIPTGTFDNNGVWDAFERVWNTPQNLEALDREKIERPGNRGSFEY